MADISEAVIARLDLPDTKLAPMGSAIPAPAKIDVARIVLYAVLLALAVLFLTPVYVMLVDRKSVV